MSQMLKSSGAMGVATMLSRVLGLAREVVYAKFMGDTWVAGAFTLAFMVPNLFRRLLGEGALSAAFIPVFKEKEKTAGDAEMWRASNAVLSGLFASAAALVVLAVLGISLLLRLGVHAGDTLRLVHLLEAGFPWIVLISIAALVLALRERSRATLGRARRIGVGVGAGLTGLFFALLGGVSLALSVNLEDGQTKLMLDLLRWMFPYVLLVCVAAIFMGMLNARGHFFVPAMGATMLNLVMIASVLLLAPLMGRKLEEQIFGLAIGVVLAGVAQAIFQLPLLHSEGFAYQWVSPWRDETVRHVVKQMVPGAVGVAAFQINVLVTQGFAFAVDGSVVASFNYAVRLMELPQGVFGISLATYLLPTLSGLAAEKKYPEYRATLRQGVGWLVFVNLLASVLLLTLAEPMVRRVVHCPRRKRPDVPGPRTGGVLARQHPGAGVLFARRHKDADADQRVLSGSERAAGAGAGVTLAADGVGGGEHVERAHQRFAAVLRAAAETEDARNGRSAPALARVAGGDARCRRHRLGAGGVVGGVAGTRHLPSEAWRTARPDGSRVGRLFRPRGLAENRLHRGVDGLAPRAV